MYEKVLKHYDIMTVGEGPGISKEVGLNYVGHDRGELNMIFHLDHMFLGHGPLGKFDPVPYSWQDVKDLINDWDAAMGRSGWISVFLDNHDFPRLVSRFGNDKEYRLESAKLLAMMVLTLRGTPCIYQGSELGMSNVHFDSIEDYRDIETHNYYKEFTERGLSPEAFLELVHENGRDNVRTPMQWDDSEHAGFTTGTPWIKANPNYIEINSEKVLADKNSIYYFYQKFLAYRKQTKTLIYGAYEPIATESDKLFVYRRKDKEADLVIVLNHSDLVESCNIDLSEYRLEIQNLENKMAQVLLPWEARLYRKL